MYRQNARRLQQRVRSANGKKNAAEVIWQFVTAEVEIADLVLRVISSFASGGWTARMSHGAGRGKVVVSVTRTWEGTR